MDKSRHTSVKFCDLTKASAEINNPRFIHLEEFEDETFEVWMTYLWNYSHNLFLLLIGLQGF